MKYQYATVASNMATSPSLRNFVIDNEAIHIEYDFNAEKCPVKVLIFNKLDTPLYVNWKESVMVSGGESYSYWDGAPTSAEVSLIPPKATKQVNFLSMQPTSFVMPDSRIQFNINTLNGGLRALKQGYTKHNTPLLYRSYLVCSLDGSFKTKQAYDSEFWVDEIVETRMPPDEYNRVMQPRSRFHNSTLSGFGNVMATVLLVGAIALKVALSP